MLTSSNNVSIFHEYNKLLVHKIDCSTRSINPNHTDMPGVIKDVYKQLEFLSAIGSSDEKNLKFLITEINNYFSQTNMDYLEAAGNIKGTKEKIFIDSLKMELTQIIAICKDIKDVLNSQLELLKGERYAEYKAQLMKEESLSKKLKNLLDEDNALEQAYQNNLREVKKLLQSDVASGILHGIARIEARFHHRFLKPLGMENIPSTGAVIFAPRHFGVNSDYTLMSDAIPRRIFIIAAAEFVRSDFMAFMYRNTMEKAGLVPTIRQESMKQYDDGTRKDRYEFSDARAPVVLKKMVNLLSLNQAVVIFPEGHANFTPKFTYKEKNSGIIPLKEGLAICLEMAEFMLNKRISVVPVGIIYDERHNSVRANFGKSMYYFPKKYPSLKECMIQNQSLRNTFDEVLRSEIARLSEVGLSEVKEEKYKDVAA